MKRNQFIVVLAVLVSSFTAFFYFLVQNSAERPLKSYKHEAACLAVAPECGYCPGQVRGTECFVKKATLRQFE
jgi:hypothetical protein